MAKNESNTRNAQEANQKIFAVRGFDERLAKEAKILAIRQDKSLREIMEEAVLDILKKYQQPFEP